MVCRCKFDEGCACAGSLGAGAVKMLSPDREGLAWRRLDLGSTWWNSASTCWDLASIRAPRAAVPR